MEAGSCNEGICSVEKGVKSDQQLTGAFCESKGKEDKCGSWIDWLKQWFREREGILSRYVVLGNYWNIFFSFVSTFV